MRYFISSFLMVIILLSCSKTEEIIIGDNQAPPDNTIENVTKENYINKLYISLLGRKATDQEFSNALELINSDNLGESSRDELVSTIQSQSEYFINEYELARASLLNGIDTNDINSQIAALEIVLMTTNDPDEIELINNAKIKLERLTTIPSQLNSEGISFADMHSFCVDNYLYDEINMGTENFIVSMYQNFFFRYPTSEELAEATLCVDGFQGIVFYEIGESKQDFINLLFESEEYFEGQSRNLYLRYLFREPNTEEMSGMATNYKNGQSYQEIQRTILTSDEYVGL